MGELSPLPRSLDPLPGEALPGYLLRLAHRLGQPPIRITTITGLTSARTVVIPSRFLLQLSAAEASRFCHACRLTPQETAGLCLTSLAGRYPPLDLAIHHGPWLRQARGITGLSRWVLTTSTRYCPECLTGDTSPAQQRHGGAWKKAWRIPLMFACTIHQRLLATHCPACHAPACPGRSGLINRPGELLHPAQCRAIPGTAGGNPRGRPACGQRLDQGSAPAGPAITGHIAGLQQRFLALLQPDGPDTVTSIGRPVPVSRYLLDLRLITALIRLTWPMARNLTRAASFAEAIDEHAGQQDKALHTLREQGRRTAPVVLYDTPPLEPAACAGLLDAAAQFLDLADPPVSEDILHPLITEAFGDPRWIRFTGLAKPACSPALQAMLASIESKQNARRPPSRRGENLRRNTASYRWRGRSPSQAPRPSCQFSYRHIPQHLTTQWFERHLAPIASDINPQILRRAAAIRLVQMTCELTIAEASALLEVPESKSRSAIFTVDSWARHDSASTGQLITALDAIADELESSAHPIDYATRRDALRAWTIPPAGWDDLAAPLRARPTAGPPADWGERYRRAASVLAWMQITQGERGCAPLMRARQHAAPSRSQLADDLSQAIYRSRRHPRERHGVLLHTLKPYTEQLARRIDHGATITSGPFLPS